MMQSDTVKCVQRLKNSELKDHLIHHTNWLTKCSLCTAIDGNKLIDSALPFEHVSVEINDKHTTGSTRLTQKGYGVIQQQDMYTIIAGLSALVIFH